MANTSLGQILEIDEKTLGNIGNVSTKITAIGDSVEAASKKFQEEFGKMNTSATTLNTTLTTIKDTLSAMGVDLTKPLAENLNNAATSANNAAASITTAAKAMGEFGATSGVASDKLKELSKSASESSVIDPKIVEYKEQIDRVKASLSELQKLENSYKTAQSGVSKNTKAYEGFQRRIESVRSRISALVNQLNDLSRKYDTQVNKPLSDWLAKREQEDKLQQATIARESKQLELRIQQMQRLAQQKLDKSEAETLKKEQRIYSDLEKQLIRLGELKRKSIGSAGQVKDIESYQKILNLIQRISSEMESMRSKNSKLKDNELALIAAKQKEADFYAKIGVEQDKIAAKRQTEYREMEKMYAKLFDIAAAREKAANDKQQKKDNQELKEQQRIYSQLEKQYIRLNNLKMQSIGTAGQIKDATTYEMILDLIKRTSSELEKMRSKNSKLKSDETAMLSILQKEAELKNRVAQEQQKIASQQKDEAQRRRVETRETEIMYQRLFDLAIKREGLAKKRNDSKTLKDAKEEQRIYSQLEQQLIKLNALKQKSVGADGLVKDAANYQKILDLMQKTEQEMQKMIAANPKLKQNELAIVAARQREVEVTQKLSREQDKLNAKKLKEYYETPKGALDFANAQMKSYQQRAQAIKYLETAMRNLDTSEGKNRDTLQQLYGAQQRLRTEQEKSASIMGDMKGKIDKVTSTAKQLASTLGVVFSVQAIKGFVSKLIEVRGEFELQNTALRAILQNKDEADRLFAQVVQLAVKSPYSIRQLTSYTKQLAAYRVESDKLYDTTKRLADVSSGLGVDMQRIILAFGQVKAANYLRATEVRQFTEAGINVLGELSKYYSELEGRMVSVADVQERITKRMVEFGDVEEIFRRMTDAGGLFYNMQAKQAATLRGMMMNLKDSMDIMFNEIGKSTEGTLKGVVNMLTNLLRNWRDVMAFMKPFLASFVALKSAMKLYAIGMKDAGTQVMWFSRNIKNLGPQTLAVAKGLTATNMNVLGLNGGYKTLIRTMRTMQPVIMGLGRAFMAIAPVAAIAAVVALITHLRKATREAKRLDEEINKTISESVADYKKSEAELKNLVSRLHDVNTGSYEHQQIIDKLNSQYGDYIGFLVTENTTYEQMTGTLDTVIARLKEKSAYEASGKALQQAYESQTAAMDEARMQMLDAHVYVKGVQQERKLTEREVDIFLNNYEKKVRELGRELTFEEQYNVLSETLGLEISSFNFAVGGWNKINSLTQSILKTKQKELDVQNTINSRYDDQFSTVQQSLAMERLEARKRAALAEIDKKNTLSAFEREKAIQAVELSYQRDRIANELSFGMITEDAAKKRLRALMEEPKLMASINKKFKELAENAGFTEEEYSKLLFTSTKWEKGLTSVEKQIKETWEAQGDIIAQQNRYKEQGLEYNEQELAQAEKQQQLYALMAQTLGISLEEEKKADKANNEAVKERIDLLKKMRQEYEQNRKVMGEDEASAFTKSQFKDNAIFKQLQKMGVIDATLNVDSSGLITALKRLAAQSSEAARKEIEAMIATLSNEQVTITITANLEDVKAEVEGLFDRLNLTKELEKLGLDKAITEQLFGFETIDLKGLREQLEIIKAEYAKNNHGIGEEQQKYFAEMEKKITDMEQKELMERLKNYAQYLKKEASVAVQAKLDEARELAKLEATQELTEPQKEVIRTRIKEETRTKVDKAMWDQFKNTDMYIRMFEDLDFVSTSALTAMEQKLNELRTSLKNLDPQNLKEIQNQLQKIQEVKMQRNPLQAMIDALREVNDLRKEGLTLDRLEQQSATYQTQADAARNEIDTLEYIIGLRNLGSMAEAAQYAIEQERYDLIDVTDDRLREQVAEQENIKKSAEANLEVTNRNLKSYSDAAKSLTNFAGAMEKLGDDIGKIFGSVNEIMAGITGESSDVVGSIGEISDSLIQAVSSAIMLSEAFKKIKEEANSALGIIGLIAMALEAVVSLVSSIVSANDNRLARQIEQSERRVERLEQAYESLDRVMSNAYDIGKLKAYNAEMERNLEIQKAELQGQIALYRDRKGGESKYQSEIDDLKKQIDEIDQTLSDNVDRLIEKMGGFGGESSIASAAEGFVDAWYDAYKETGSGLDALGDKFGEFYDNLMKRQILAVLGEKYLEPVLRMIDQAVSENSEAGMIATRNEIDMIKRTYEEASRQFDEQAKMFMDELGMGPGAGATGELSGLAEDYGQMTEATATALASINESIRYFESDSNLVLHAMHNILTVPGENPFYLTMLEQARYTREIRDAIRAMTYSVGVETGLKVRMI